jgi:hypothetical protein
MTGAGAVLVDAGEQDLTGAARETPASVLRRSARAVLAGHRRWVPLAAAAMAGVLPQEILDRRTGRAYFCFVDIPTL